MNPNGFPQSGSWSGYYAYAGSNSQHTMKLHLTFDRSGAIEGDGVDDIATFRIAGVFDPVTRQAVWKKVYFTHTVAYSGVYDGRNILGDWLLAVVRGSFRIWPSALSDDLGVEEEAELDVPVEVLASGR